MALSVHLLGSCVDTYIRQIFCTEAVFLLKPASSYYYYYCCCCCCYDYYAKRNSNYYIGYLFIIHRYTAAII